MTSIDGAGEVVEIGAGVTKFKISDRVSPIPMPGFHGVSTIHDRAGRKVGLGVRN